MLSAGPAADRAETMATQSGASHRARPAAFGALGVMFWNWDHLSDTFIAEVGEFLGHRVVYAYHRL